MGITWVIIWVIGVTNLLTTLFPNNQSSKELELYYRDPKRKPKKVKVLLLAR